MLSAAVLSLTAACSKGGGEIPPYEPSGINLTAGAAYANCFIVDEAGTIGSRPGMSTAPPCRTP